MKTQTNRIAKLVAVAVVAVLAIVLISMRKTASSVESSAFPELASETAQSALAVSSGKNRAPGERKPAGAVTAAVNMEDLLHRLTEWQTETDPMRKVELERELEALLTDANAEEVLRALPSEWLKTFFAECALRHWAAKDRVAAANWVAEHPELDLQQKSVVMSGWFQEDHNGFRDYLNGLPEGRWKQTVLRFAADDALVAGRPLEGIEFLRTMKEGRERTELLGAMVTSWSRNDSKAALEWAQTIDDPALKQKALGSAIVGSAWQDPQAAAEILASSTNLGQQFNESLEGVVRIWAQKDPQAVASWVSQFNNENARQTAIKALVNIWSYSSYPAAKAWVESLRAGPAREQAAAILAEAAGQFSSASE